jgi:hypothetical protein
LCNKHSKTYKFVNANSKIFPRTPIHRMGREGPGRIRRRGKEGEEGRESGEITKETGPS